MRIPAAVLIVLFTLIVPGVVAQKDVPKYDPAKEVKITGTVENVKTVPASCLGEDGLHLTVLNLDSKQSAEVQVAPAAFLKEMEVSFAKGEKVEIVGVRVKVPNGEELMLAREIVHANDTVTVRDKTGEPVWNWNKKKRS